MKLLGSLSKCALAAALVTLLGSFAGGAQAELPPDLAARIDAKQREWASRGTLGFAFRVTRVDELGSPASPRLVICALSPGGPAERSGMAVGDTLLAWAGAPLDADQRSAARVFEQVKAGEPIEVRLLRQGTELSVQLRPGSPTADERERWVTTWIVVEYGVEAMAEYRNLPLEFVYTEEGKPPEVIAIKPKP